MGHALFAKTNEKIDRANMKTTSGRKIRLNDIPALFIAVSS